MLTKSSGVILTEFATKGFNQHLTSLIASMSFLIDHILLQNLFNPKPDFKQLAFSYQLFL